MSDIIDLTEHRTLTRTDESAGSAVITWWKNPNGKFDFRIEAEDAAADDEWFADQLEQIARSVREKAAK